MLLMCLNCCDYLGALQMHCALLQTGLMFLLPFSQFVKDIAVLQEEGVWSARQSRSLGNSTLGI